ncbi:MAG: hypothetical protein ACLU4N_14030 [Butyricimonas faecihominis]
MTEGNNPYENENDHFEIVTKWRRGSTLLYSLCAIGGSIRTFYGNSYDSLFIDSPKITVEAELKDKQMRLKSLKGSPGWEEHNRILESLPSSLTIQKVYDRIIKLFMNITRSNRPRKI